jgi:uncharacterized protein YndB with AHSA1/START domain
LTRLAILGAMAGVTSSITIQRPIEDVFAILTDVEKTGRWFPGDVDEHWITPPPHGVGSRRRAVVTMLGRRMENEAEAIEYDPPRRAAMRGLSPNAPFVVAIDFRPSEGGTRVDVTSQIELRGPGRVAAPIVTWLYARGWSRGLANLKRMMEAGEL